MYEISCEMCRDLIPLVEDGVASADSRAAVEHHLQNCPVCNGQPLAEQIPAGDEKKALIRFMNRVKLIGLAMLGLGVLAGVLMTEQFIQGASVIFALLILLIGRMVYGVWQKKRENWGRREWVRLLLAAGMAVGMLSVLHALTGNPVSRLLAQRGAEAHIAARYADSDYQVERVTYNFKMGNYYAVITSPTCVDDHFDLYLDMKGNVTHDWYESDVTSGMNTRNRLEKEYRDLVDPILKKLNLETSTHIADGRLDLEGVELEVNGNYEIQSLGSQYGHLIVTVRDEEVSVERAEELLLRVEELMVQYGGAYATIDFSLWSTESGGLQLNLEILDRSTIQDGLRAWLDDHAVITGQGGTEQN